MVNTKMKDAKPFSKNAMDTFKRYCKSLNGKVNITKYPKDPYAREGTSGEVILACTLGKTEIDMIKNKRRVVIHDSSDIITIKDVHTIRKISGWTKANRKAKTIGGIQFEKEDMQINVNERGKISGVV